jgi:REP element-mobilizing transposase RayT
MQETTHPWHRRSLRLKGYDYRGAGAYFLTICAHQRACLFGEILDGVIRENRAGLAVREAWEALPDRFPDIELDAFVVMPNHVHGVVLIGDNHDHDHLSRVVGAFKSLTVYRYNQGVASEGWPRYDGKLWQRNYYEHVIRNEVTLNEVREYIMGNPGQWLDDPEHPMVQRRDRDRDPDV